MKRYVFLLKWHFILVSIIAVDLGYVRAQEGPHDKYQLEVSYSFLLNQGTPTTFEGTLLIGSESSLFSYHVLPISQQEELSSELSSWDQQNYNFQIVDSTTYYIWSLFLEDRVFHLERLPRSNTLCVVKEAFPDISWRLTGNKKSIHDFICFEAIGHFAGREYTVWFTEQIPSLYGPWKFHGLPGLIVQLEDSLGEVQFFVKSVQSFPNTQVVDNPFQNDSFQVLDRTSYLEEVKHYFKSLEKRMISRVGRGYEVKVKSTPIRSIEIYDF